MISRNKDNKEENHEEGEGDDGDVVELCPWIGPWSDLQKHIDECPLHIIKCVNTSAITPPSFVHKEHKDVMMRRDAAKHYKTCPYAVMECKRCKEKFEKWRFGVHESVYCQEKIIDCEYKQHGCWMKNCKRREIQQHMKISAEIHLSLVSKSYTELKQQLQGTEKQVKTLDKKVTNLMKKLKKLSDKIE